MDKFLSGLGIFVLFMLIFVAVATFSAWFVMIMVNYLFNPMFIATVFGVGQLTFWKAWVLSLLTGTLFKSTSTSK
jgi:hypothetical protein